MVEILWKSDPSERKLREREFFELRCVDLGVQVKPRFVVREIHAVWSQSDQRIKWNGFQDESCSTPEEALQHFAARKVAIMAKGFNRSNLDPALPVEKVAPDFAFENV
jgi:hypothetical protein